MNVITESNKLVDKSRPWLGLASFSEETRAYFHGRDEEVGELARRVQRKLLTVLFGQSGLGKTSILRAGIVPRLREQGYCPVYVRVDYSASAPSPAEQVRRAIHDVAPLSGFEAGEGESLWELLHRRDLTLRDADGRAVIPLLIIDQFEEMFTLAQGDDAGRAKASAFIEELAGLVENRPPSAVEGRLEDDDTLIDRFDFASEDYRVLIALREDYLAHLEQLKKAMPSITQNRMRLAPMTGAQALAAVTGPGERLVNEEVAAAIVRFVANGAEIVHAQVEPSLLSLICRELNDARIAAGRSEISLDLLAGSHASILSDFYERALAGHPAAVRNVVEDVLLTGSGFRENVAEERVLHTLADAGAAPSTLADLVNRRLLRIEERLDIRRVELTHDVLCSVVRASRDQRRERNLLEEGERALAARQAREQAAHKSLVRTRQVAVACVTLAVAAIGASVYAYHATQRAKASTATARAIQSESDQARRQAEQLTAYLLDDFARELSGVSKQQMFVDLGKRVQQYYDGLPGIAPNSETELYRALAQVTYANALLKQNKVGEASPVIEAAVATMERRHAAGLRSDQDNIALSQTLLAQAELNHLRGQRGIAHAKTARSYSILAPAMAGLSPSTSVRRAYASARLAAAARHQLNASWADSLLDVREARAVLLSLGATQIFDLSATLSYVESGSYLARGLLNTQRGHEALTVAQEMIDLADKVLATRPGHILALKYRSWANYYAARANAAGGNGRAALPFAQQGIDDAAQSLLLDPGNTVMIRSLLSTMNLRAELLLNLGDLSGAAAQYQTAAAQGELFGYSNTGVSDSAIKTTLSMTALYLQLNNIADAERMHKISEAIYRAKFEEPPIDYFLALKVRQGVSLALARGQSAAALRMSEEALAKIKPRVTSQLDKTSLDMLFESMAEIKLVAGDAQGALDTIQQSTTLTSGLDTTPHVLINSSKGALLIKARALAARGRGDKAVEVVQQVAAAYQRELARGSDRAAIPLDLAEAYAVLAMASKEPQRERALVAARAALAKVPAALATTRRAVQVRKEITSGGRPGPHPRELQLAE